MTEQTRNNKQWLGKLEREQEELVYSLIGQALHAAKTAGLSANVWMDGGELRITIRGARQQYMIFTDKDKSDIGALVDAVEWLLSQPPKEDEPKESEE